MSAWDDRPTHAQLNAIFGFIKWKVPTSEAIDAVEWLAERGTRREVRYELKRIRELYNTHKLGRDNCFEGEIWEGFIHE